LKSAYERELRLGEIDEAPFQKIGSDGVLLPSVQLISAVGNGNSFVGY
jgi:hypothetical protein